MKNLKALEVLSPDDIEGKRVAWVDEAEGLLEVDFGDGDYPPAHGRLVRYSKDLVLAFKQKRVTEFREQAAQFFKGHLVLEGNNPHGMIITLQSWPSLDYISLGRQLWDRAAISGERCGPGIHNYKALGGFGVYFFPLDGVAFLVSGRRPDMLKRIDAEIKGITQLQVQLKKDLARLNETKRNVEKELE